MQRSLLMRALAYALAAAGAGAAPANTRLGATGSAGAVAQRTPGCLPSRDGYLRLRLRGSTDLDVDWSDAQMRCEGAPRPDRRGFRLTFAGRAQPGNHRLRFLFGIDAAPVAGAAREVDVNLTVIFEGEHRLYSTLGPGKCTVDRLWLEPMATPAGALRVTAHGFCVGPAVAVDGNGELLVTRFDFIGPLQAAPPAAHAGAP